MSQPSRITRVTYNGEQLRSSYANGMLWSMDGMGFSIRGNVAPCAIDISPQTTMQGEPSGVMLRFTPANGAAHEVLLPSESLLPWVKERMVLRRDYTAMAKAFKANTGVASITAFSDLDTQLSHHHDRCANWLEQCLADADITPLGERRTIALEGEKMPASEATRALFGAITDGLTPLLERINPDLGASRAAGHS